MAKVELTFTIIDKHSFEKLHDEQADILIYVEKGAEVDIENNCE